MGRRFKLRWLELIGDEAKAMENEVEVRCYVKTPDGIYVEPKDYWVEIIVKPPYRIHVEEVKE